MSGEERRETDARADPDRGGSGTAADRINVDEAASTPSDALALMPLDRVLDRDADPEDRNVAVVVKHARESADEHRIDALDGSPTVAALNPEHPPDASVVVVAFEGDLDRDASGWRSVPRGDLAGRLAGTAVSTYAYPATRLEKVELATDGGTTPRRGKLMHPASASKRKARRTPLRKERPGTSLPSSTVGISVYPSTSSAAAGRRRAWLRGPERLDHATTEPGGTMNTNSHPDSEANSNDHDDHDPDRRLVTDGGTRSTDADTATDTADTLGVGVYDEDAVGVERAAEQRGRYLARTTALDERPAKAVALSEMGFTDSGIAKRIDATEGTVTGYLDAVADRYGIGATFPKAPAQRGKLNATGGER